MWLELLARHHDVTQRHRCAGPSIRIGRAYDNDVVLDDPYVAPHHLLLRRTDTGGWIAEDLGSAGKLRAEHGKARFDNLALDDDRVFRIGNTLLRLRSEQYQVAPERVDGRRLPLWPVALLLAIGIVGIELVVDWLSETQEVRLGTYIGGLRWIGLLSLVWVGVWTILSYIFAKHARFERHLTIALAGVFSFSAIDEVLKYAGFALSVQPVLGYEYLVMWAIVGLVGFGHLQQIAPRLWRLTGSVVAALAVLAAAGQTLNLSEDRRNFDPPPIQGRLYPPDLRLVPAETDLHFFAQVAKLKDKLDASRKDDDR